MHDGLTIIIILLIVAIVLDGIRRMRQSRRENLRLSRNAQKADEETKHYTESGSEFPSGGARVKGYRDDGDAQSLNQQLKESYEATRTTVGAPQRIPEQVVLNLEESVPMLMESVEVSQAGEAETIADDFAQAQCIEEHDRRDELAGGNTIEEEIEMHREPTLGSLDVLQESAERVSGDTVKQPSTHSRATPQDKTKTKKSRSKKSKTPFRDKIDKTIRSESVQKPQSEPQAVEPEEVIIINVMARSGERFGGRQLLNALMTQELKYGAREIFHRCRSDENEDVVIFSLANMVVPGTFNLAEMDDFQTPGVSLFLMLPVSGESIKAYDDMVSTARSLAEELGGELKDENRSVMTSQTIEHGRQRVIEYERKKRLERV